MTTYISILRGINVSGQKIIKMDALKKMYENLNFEDIQTYVQSGNVIFSSKENEPKKLEKIISSKIKTQFGFDIPVIVLSAKTLETIIKNNPFAKDKLKDISFLHVTFLADKTEQFSKESIIEKNYQTKKLNLHPMLFLYTAPMVTVKLNSTIIFWKTNLKYKQQQEIGKCLSPLKG